MRAYGPYSSQGAFFVRYDFDQSDQAEYKVSQKDNFRGFHLLHL